MDIMKKLQESGERDIIISLSKDKSWIEYLSFFIELRIDNQNFSFILSQLPKTISGKKCYIIYDGLLRGYMEIYKFRETPDNDFCMELLPILQFIPHKLKMAEVIDFKYFLDNFNMQ